MPRATRIFGIILASLTACQEAPTNPALVPIDEVAEAGVGSWTARKDYPTVLHYAASASIINSTTTHTTVYVIGGTLAQDDDLDYPDLMTNAVKAYDATANTWKARAPLPITLQSSNGAVEIAGKIYVSGGYTRVKDSRGFWQWKDSKALYVYDPAANKWTKKRDMQIATSDGVSAAYEGMLYVVTWCGEFGTPLCNQGLFKGILWRYNPTTNQWTNLGRTPHAPLAGGFIGGKLYLSGDDRITDIWDVATNRWSVGAPRPGTHPSCSRSAAITFQAKLYLVACATNSEVLRTLFYNPATNAWSEAALPPLGYPLGTTTVHRVFVGGLPRLGVIGGPKPRNHYHFVP
jgi:hypothetical protein